ncbi:MAG: acyl-CoA thioesterase [Deltaproteobacteria bacterium]|nr:acyl-CoA thioesterase [Deltaproteobacteria bacterium]
MENGKSCEVGIRVPFHDLDPMNIVWHGNLMKYFDVARFALLDQCGIDLQDYFEKTSYLFPIIKTATKHIVALRNRDELLCKVTVREAKIKIVMDFEIRRSGQKQICASGRSEQVAVLYPEMKMMFEIPEDIRTPLGF